jgi:hypothetical protein
VAAVGGKHRSRSTASSPAPVLFGLETIDDLVRPELSDMSPDGLATVVAAYMVFKANCKAEFTLAARMKFGAALEIVEKDHKELLMAKWSQLDRERMQMGSNRLYCTFARTLFDRYLVE